MDPLECYTALINNSNKLKICVGVIPIYIERLPVVDSAVTLRGVFRWSVERPGDVYVFYKERHGIIHEIGKTYVDITGEFYSFLLGFFKQWAQTIDVIKTLPQPLFEEIAPEIIWDWKVFDFMINGLFHGGLRRHGLFKCRMQY